MIEVSSVNFTDINLIFDVDSFKKSTNVTVTIFIGINKLPV